MFDRKLVECYNLDPELADKSQYIVRKNDPWGCNLFYYCETREEALEMLDNLYEDKHYGEDFFMLEPDGTDRLVCITGYDW